MDNFEKDIRQKYNSKQGVEFQENDWFEFKSFRKKSKSKRRRFFLMIVLILLTTVSSLFVYDLNKGEKNSLVHISEVNLSEAMRRIGKESRSQARIDSLASVDEKITGGFDKEATSLVSREKSKTDESSIFFNILADQVESKPLSSNPIKSDAEHRRSVPLKAKKEGLSTNLLAASSAELIDNLEGEQTRETGKDFVESNSYHSRLSSIALAGIQNGGLNNEMVVMSSLDLVAVNEIPLKRPMQNVVLKVGTGYSFSNNRDLLEEVSSFNDFSLLLPYKKKVRIAVNAHFQEVTYSAKEPSLSLAIQEIDAPQENFSLIKASVETQVFYMGVGLQYLTYESKYLRHYVGLNYGVERMLSKELDYKFEGEMDEEENVLLSIDEKRLRFNYPKVVTGVELSLKRFIGFVELSYIHEFDNRDRVLPTFVNGSIGLGYEF